MGALGSAVPPGGRPARSCAANGSLRHPARRYTLYKFCELLGEDEYLQYFPLLKSNEKLFAQDQIWRKICKDLRWEFIPSV